MPTKEEEFKQHLAAVLQDLQTALDDAEMMWLLGSLAAALVDKGGARSWPALKQQLDRQSYDALLRDFQVQGNAFHAEGKARHAYAVQALGFSLVARTQLDPQVKTGEALLDEVIERAIAGFRQAGGSQAIN